MSEVFQDKLKHVINGKQKACVILITCEEPKEDGNMQVEMVYEGEAYLASYLLDTAQTIFEEQFNKV